MSTEKKLGIDHTSNRLVSMLVMVVVVVVMMGRQGRTAGRTGRWDRLRKPDNRLRRWLRRRRVVVGDALEGAVVVLLALALPLRVAGKASGLGVVAHSFDPELRISGGWFQSATGGGLMVSISGLAALAAGRDRNFARLRVHFYYPFWASLLWAFIGAQVYFKEVWAHGDSY